MSSLRQHLSLDEIDKMRKRILHNLYELDTKKYLLRSHDRVKLINHHNLILNTFDNMINILKVEQSDPYNYSSSPQVPNELIKTNRTVIYNPDGSTSIMKKSKLSTTNEEWERQFDESMLHNPPCYQLPPYSLTDIDKIKKSSQDERLRSL